MISAESIAGLIKEELETGGLFLVEASVRPGNRITVYIDSFRGVTIDECIRISRFIEKNLDRDTEDFELEVSSPGLERPIRKREDFVRYADRLARIKLREPIGEQKVLVGTLLGLEGDTVILALEKETVRIDLENIVKARLTL